MNKISFFLLCGLLYTANLNAQQKGDIGLGGGIVMENNVITGSKTDYPNIGIKAKFQYSVTAPIRFEGSYTFRFPKKENGISLNMYDIDLSLQYLLPLSRGISLYPLAGFSIVGAKAKDNDNNIGRITESRFHFGCGLDFKIADIFFLNTRFKYNKTDIERWSSDGFWFSVGMVKRFSSKHIPAENIGMVGNIPIQPKKEDMGTPQAPITYSEQTVYCMDNNVKLNKKQVRRALQTNEEALDLYNKGLRQQITGNLLFWPGVGIASFGVYSLSAATSFENRSIGFMGIAAGFTLTISGALVLFDSRKTLAKSVSTYNNERNKSMLGLKFGVTQNGLGLALVF